VIFAANRTRPDEPWPVQGPWRSSRECDRGEEQLSITVVFTNGKASLAPLRFARRLAQDLGARICILIPQIVSYALPLDRPPVDAGFRARQLYQILEEEARDARIEVRLCRDLRTGVVDALRPQSLVIIGSRNRWWPVPEKSLARALRRAGHQVIMVPRTD